MQLAEPATLSGGAGSIGRRSAGSRWLAPPVLEPNELPIGRVQLAQAEVRLLGRSRSPGHSPRTATRRSPRGRHSGLRSSPHRILRAAPEGHDERRKLARGRARGVRRGAHHEPADRRGPPPVPPGHRRPRGRRVLGVHGPSGARAQTTARRRKRARRWVPIWPDGTRDVAQGVAPGARCDSVPAAFVGEGQRRPMMETRSSRSAGSSVPAGKRGAAPRPPLVCWDGSGSTGRCRGPHRCRRCRCRRRRSGRGRRTRRRQSPRRGHRTRT